MRSRGSFGAFFLVLVVVCASACVLPAAGEAAAASAKRLRCGEAPPLTHRQMVEQRAPVAPFHAGVVYRTPDAPEADSDDGAEAATSGSVRRLLIVVNDSLYESIDDLLDIYIADVEGEGYTVELVELSGGTAAGLRDLLQTKYAEADSLEAVYLIGNLVVPLFCHPNDYGTGSPAIFSCELYLMDMDGAWTDTDGNGLLDLHTAGTGDEGPEIYTGRTLAHNLWLESGQNEVTLIRRYLSKVHDWRLGVVTSNVKACLYTDDDWASAHTAYSNQCAYAWSNREDYYDALQTTAADYKVKLQTPYEHMRLACHSGSTVHIFRKGAEEGGEVDSSDIVNAPPQVIYYNLYACSNADWNEGDCMGVWYTMNSGPGLGATGSTKTGGMNDNGPYYQPIGEFYPIGYAMENWFNSFQPYDDGEISWTFGMLWLGDPTLWRTRVAPETFWLVSPGNGAQYSGPDLWLSWQTSHPAGVYETVTYTLIVDNNEDMCSPELVAEGLTTTQYHITAADGLAGVYQYWRVIATTNFGKTRNSTNTGWFTIALDGDLDGMADNWEDANGLDSADASDALHDADGDGLLNREEHDLNSDPCSGDSPAFVYVDDDNAGDPGQDGSAAHPYGSIQAAIDAASAPAVVKVLPGTYAEFLTMASQVWVVGSGSATTTVEPPVPGPVVLFDAVQDGLLAGVTVASDPTSVLVRSLDSSATVRDCVLAGANNGMGVSFTGSMKLINCLLVDNAQYGLWAGGTVIVDVINCTVANNAACGAKVAYYNTVRLENSIFFGSGDDLSISSKANVTATYCDIGDGDFPGGCFSADPLFVAGPCHGYYLSQTAAGQAATSPCVNAGNPICITGVDRLTTRTDSVRDTGTVDLGCHSPYALRIGSITAASPVTLEWNAQPGLEYVVEWSIDRQNWNEVDVGETGSWIDTDTTAYAMKYYRVREK